MGLASIWDGQGDSLTKKSKSFSARSTGCSCCSSELENAQEVHKEALESLKYIIKACRYFKWDLTKLTKESLELVKSDDKEAEMKQ